MNKEMSQFTVNIKVKGILLQVSASTFENMNNTLIVLVLNCAKNNITITAGQTVSHWKI